MQRRDFFTSLGKKLTKGLVHSCYEFIYKQQSYNIFINNNSKNILIIDLNTVKFNKLENINYSYVDFKNINLSDFIIKLNKQFGYNVSLLSKDFYDIDVSNYILIDTDKAIQTNTNVLFCYDVSNLENANANYASQTSQNKDIYLSNLYNGSKLSENFNTRISTLIN